MSCTESRPYKDFVVKVNGDLADSYYPINSEDKITIELPTDASFYGGHHTEELQIFANPNSAYKLSTDYQSANDSDAKIISIKCLK